MIPEQKEHGPSWVPIYNDRLQELLDKEKELETLKQQVEEVKKMICKINEAPLHW